MRYIFELNHPKHYYQFRVVMHKLEAQGHELLVLARDKDVLLKVLEEEHVPYEVFGQHNKSMAKKIWGTFALLHNYHRIARQFKPDVIVSKASFYGCFTAWRMRKKSVIFPDSEVVKVTNKYVVPLCTKVVTPENFTLDYGPKHIKVKGVFENCYLAPSVFTPDASVVKKFGLSQPYAVFRFVGWFANHDVKNSGFTLEEKIQMVKAVEPYMHVYVSSEKTLPEELAPYKLPTPASAIHHVLSFADLYLGDSQTMATEAALLGTPAIRSNSFVGEHDMSNFIMLEKTYGLLRNVPNFEEVMPLLREFASVSQKAVWVEKQQSYFASVGDSNAEILDILTHKL